MCKETCRYSKGRVVQISLKAVFFSHNLVYGPQIWIILVGDET